MRSGDVELHGLLLQYSRKRKKPIVGFALNPEIMFVGRVKKVTDQLVWIIQLDDLGGHNGTIIIRISDIHHLIEDPIDFYREHLNSMMSTAMPGSQEIIDEDDDTEYTNN